MINYTISKCINYKYCINKSNLEGNNMTNKNCNSNNFNPNHCEKYRNDCNNQDTCCNCDNSYCAYQLSAEFVSSENQYISDSNITFADFPFVAVPATDCIRLANKNTIIVEPGRYRINYYTSINNSLDDASHDTFTALLYTDNSPLEYTRSNVRLDDPSTEHIGFLTKTNLIAIEYTSNIQFGVQINDSTFLDPVSYHLFNVAITVEKIG